MNDITKKSFYSFLTLYLVSSFILLFSTSYWFYSSQMSQQKSNDYYKMRMIADSVSSKVVKAHMMNKEFKLDFFEYANVALFDANKKLLYGLAIQDVDFSQHKYMNGDVFTVVTTDTSKHLNVAYIVVQSTKCSSSLNVIRGNILYTTVFISIFIIIIAIILSNMFLRPIREKIHEIDQFVKDTTHELNTPITALMMSTSRAKSKQVYDENIIQNISISTKQLYDIYSSLSFLNFDTKGEKEVDLRFDNTIKASLEYFNELLEKKNIQVDFTSKECILHIVPTKAKMLVNNLISNAIKYSHPNTNIFIHIDQNIFIVKDQGIGIAKDKLNTIFQRFTRANSYAGGFGVGLNIVNNIVKEYKFDIEIKSEENKGTELIIKFNKLY